MATKRVHIVKRVFLNGWEPSVAGEADNAHASEHLEVNVIFTEPKGTLAALKTAEELARNLRAVIRLLAPHAVPFGSPLDCSSAAVECTERLLLDLARQAVQGPIEVSGHLYLCRDKLETLGQILGPNSLVVIGGKRCWPTEAGLIARMLRTIGHHVLFVSTRTAKRPDTVDVEMGSRSRAET